MQSLATPFKRFWPVPCAFCDAPDVPGRICDRCRRILPWNDVSCERCGQPVPSEQPAGVTCADCQQHPPPFAKARAPLLYDFPVDAALKAIKFRAQLWYAPAFAGLLLKTIRAEFADADALIPVPLHHWRHVKRGFNQAYELCRPLTRASGVRISNAAARIRATPSQAGLSAKERTRNMRRAFKVRGKLDCRHPLIIDDVITTGATCNQLAEELLRAGADSVAVLAVAHARSPRM